MDSKDKAITTVGAFGLLFLACAYFDQDGLALIFFWCAIAAGLGMYAADALKHIDQLEE